MTSALRDGRLAPVLPDSIAIPGEPQEPRYRIYVLCACAHCDGSGKEDVSLRDTPRCSGCRGEGKTLQRVAECETPQDLGVALVTLGREGEFSECPVGCLDTMGEIGLKWLISPWLPSPRNISDAARVLNQAKRR